MANSTKPDEAREISRAKRKENLEQATLNSHSRNDRVKMKSEEIYVGVGGGSSRPSSVRSAVGHHLLEVTAKAKKADVDAKADIARLLPNALREAKVTIAARHCVAVRRAIRTLQSQHVAAALAHFFRQRCAAEHAARSRWLRSEYATGIRVVVVHGALGAG